MKRKYKTPEEKRQANILQAKRWYQEHKHDPEFVERRKLYQVRYYNNLDAIKKDVVRSYNTDYVFYVRNVVTGRFEKKIAKTREKYNEISSKLHEMETRLQDLKNRFGHIKIGQWKRKQKKENTEDVK